MADTPSKIRRKGYKAYRPDMLQAEANPFNWVSHPGAWEDFREGWMKAERDFVQETAEEIYDNTPSAHKHPAMDETHVKGFLTVEHILNIQSEVDLGIQIAEDGRIWICVDGQAFLRFTPKK